MSKAAANTRRFEYKDEKSAKFWEIQVLGNSFTVRYGKIGTDGQAQTKEFADAATAEKQAEKLIAEKIGKGYQEIGSGEQSSTQGNPVLTENGPKGTITRTSSLSAPLTLARNPKIPKEYICSPFDRCNPWNKYDLTEDDRSEILDALLENLSTPDSFLIIHANDTNWERIASRCGPDSLRSECFKYGWWLHETRGGENLARGALQNPQCPSDILDKIFVAAFDEWQLDPGDIQQELAMMAGHPNASRDLLQKLFEFDDSLVMEQLANNVSCDVGLRERALARLIKGKQAKKKRAVQQKPIDESLPSTSKATNQSAESTKTEMQSVATKSLMIQPTINSKAADVAKNANTSAPYSWNLNVCVTLNCDNIPKPNDILKFLDLPCIIKGSRKLISSKVSMNKSYSFDVEMHLLFMTDKSISRPEVAEQFSKRRMVDDVSIQELIQTDKAAS